MGKVIHIDGATGGGDGNGWGGQVEFRGDLPITLGTPVIGDIWLVEKPTTFLGFTTYQSGLYIRDFNTGALSDWRRLNVKVNFTDSEFAIVNASDTSKKAKFDMSLITNSTTRTYTWQDKDGTIALLSDITASTDHHSGYNLIGVLENITIESNKEMIVSSLTVDGTLNINGILTII